MKKSMLIIFSTLIVLLSCITTQAMPVGGYSYDTFGKFLYKEQSEFWLCDGYVFGVSTLVFEYGTMTYFGDGRPPVGYLYGQEDLPEPPDDLCKTIAQIKRNSNMCLYIDVYEAGHLSKPVAVRNKLSNEDFFLVDGELRYKLQTRELNLESGKPYILMLIDNNGTLLKVDKILISE